MGNAGNRGKGPGGYGVDIIVEPLTDAFAARVSGVDLVRGLDDRLFGQISRAFEDHGIVVFHDQLMDDDQQIAFSERFGPLERTISASPTGGTPFARQSNIDIKSGDIIAAKSDRRMDYQRGNYLWHADSTFKKTPSLCSILSAREVPPVGGATEFVSTRAAFEALPAARQSALESLVVEHDLLHSRREIGFEFTKEEAAQTPPVRHPLVQVNPVTGRKSLMIGAHASHIVGWPVEKGRALLVELLDLATQAEAVYRHDWRTGDLIIWDNRSALHRATPYDSQKHRRLMQRTTVSNPNAQRA
jgi:alpha-ketoglutarate-dependent 2,4-dichlorophenoxyacetate dioxygenase